MSGAGVIKSLKAALLSPAMIGGIVSVGASIGLDAIGAPPILQNFIPGLLGQLIGSFSGDEGGGPEPGGDDDGGETIFKKIKEGIAKFGNGIVQLGQQVVSFGKTVLENGVDFLKEGFVKAINLFSGIFDRKTIEDLSDGGKRSIESTLKDHCSVFSEGIQCAYKSVEISYLLDDTFTGHKLNYKNTGVEASFVDLMLSGSFFGGDIAFAQDTGIDGIKIVQNFDENGTISRVRITDDINDLLEFSGYGSYGLKLDGEGRLMNGVMSNSFDNTRVIVENGKIISSTRREYGLLGLAGENKGKINWGLLDTDDPSQMVMAVDITEVFKDGQSSLDFNIKLDDTQKALLNSYDFDYPFAAEAFAADLSNKPAQTKSDSGYILGLFNKQASVAYDHLTEPEKAFFKEDPRRIYYAPQLFEDYREALTKAQGSFKAVKSLNGGKGDAFRHALWSALLTRTMGADLAKDFATRHEDGANTQSQADRYMDIFNNQKGREIALANPGITVEELEQIIKQAIEADELIYSWE